MFERLDKKLEGDVDACNAVSQYQLAYAHAVNDPCAGPDVLSNTSITCDTWPRWEWRDLCSRADTKKAGQCPYGLPV